MFKRILLVILATCSLFSPTIYGQKIAAADLRADLFFLQNALYAGHPGVFLFNKKDSLDRFFDQLRNRLQGDSLPLEQAQITIRLAVSRIHDGHTTVETPFFNDETMVLPFTTHVIGDKVFIVGNYSGDSTIEKGSELISVNGDPVSMVVRIGRLLHSGDGYNNSFSQAIQSVYFARHQTLLFGMRKLNALYTIGPDGKPGEHQVAPIPRAQLLKLVELKPVKPATRSYLMEYRGMILARDSLHSNLAVLQMGSFPNGRYPRFYRRVFHWLKNNKIPNLVIDLRYNTGGNVQNMDYLVSKIVTQPFQYQYERKRHPHCARYFRLKYQLSMFALWLRYNTSPRFSHARADDLNIRVWKVKPHRRDRYTGKVYVITNGWSFSSASMCASFLKNKAQAVVIGSETGGNETGNCGGGYPKLILPHTKFSIRFPLYHLRYDLGKVDRGRGVLPDYPTPYTINDILKGKDLEMEQLYRLLENKH